MNKYGYEISTLISEKEIQSRIKEIAVDLSTQFNDEIPILIGVLNGSFIFLSDLMRKMTIDCEMDFIKLSSYAGQESVGTVTLLKDISANITGRHVIIVEDIIDSGLTIKFLRDRLQGALPKSVTIVTLLLVVGYGLDYNQKLRHLPEIYRIEE
jgi:hypoxanthine phosphoribosyltransferase